MAEENYTLHTLVNTDAKILNEVLQLELKNTRKSYTTAKLGFNSEMQE